MSKLRIRAATMAIACLGAMAVLVGTAGAVVPSQVPSSAGARAAAAAVPMTIAPACIHFSQYKHGNFFTGYYTNVYLDNQCGRVVRVKVVMRNGYDSGCIQLSAGTIDYYFRSNSDNGAQPYVDRLEAC